jgi:hypothetical protein
VFVGWTLTVGQMRLRSAGSTAPAQDLEEAFTNSRSAHRGLSIAEVRQWRCVGLFCLPVFWHACLMMIDRAVLEKVSD